MVRTDAKIGVCFSDTHCGSTVGLLKPGFVTHEGNEIKLSPVQEWLYEAWQDCWKWAMDIIGDDKWFAISNGDSTEAQHHHTKQIISPDDSDHLRAAYELYLDVLHDATDVLLTEGTEVHTKNMEHALGKMLKANGVNVVAPKGKGAWETLLLEVNKTLCAFDHHVTTSLRSYLEASAFSISMGDIRNRYARVGKRVPKCFVRSHRHQYGSYDDGFANMTILPPWQGPTRYVHNKVPGAVPQCGLVLLDFRNVEPDAPPVIHRRLHTTQ